jgi:hypothetical protein
MSTPETRVKEISDIGFSLRTETEYKIDFFIAGGCFDWSRELSDIDVFFTTEDQFNQMVKFFNSKGIKIRETDNSISYIWQERKFDLVKSKFYESIEQVIESFDFINCMAGIEAAFRNFVSHKDWYLVNKQKRLAINKITYPMSSLRRAFKYAAKGYFVCHGSMLRLAEAIKNQENPLSAQPIETYPVD